MHFLSIPAIYSLELTPACNNLCPGCSNVYHGKRAYSPLSAPRWISLLQQLAPEAVQLRLTGGEPTLHPGFFDILDAATSYQAWVTVFTNGRWGRPRKFVPQLARRSHLTGLLVSLHGARSASHEAFSRINGSFVETVSNICLAIEYGIPVTISTIITAYNWGEIDAVVALARQLGVQRVAFNRYLGRAMPGVEPTREQTRAAVKRIEVLLHAGEAVTYGIGIPQCFTRNHSEGCLAGVAYASVDPWANVHPCAHSPTVVGSLLDKTITELWHSDTMARWRSLMPAECTACAAYAVCHGGCRAAQELRADSRDPLRNQQLDQFEPLRPARMLPAHARPHVSAHMRPESFGFALLGSGQVLPVRASAKAVIEACDGTNTFAQLADHFGADGLELLGELWEAGMVDI